MGRPPRYYPTPDTVYHVISRGNNRQQIFLDNRDYHRYLGLWRKHKAEMDLEIYAYVLMPNHVHWLIKTGFTPLSEIMHRMHSTYARWFNHRHERVGHLFQARYKSIVCAADSYLLVLARYIHLNPIRAGLADKLHHYPWSSFPGYSGHEDSLLNASFILSYYDGDAQKAKSKLIDFTREGIDRPDQEMPLPMDNDYIGNYGNHDKYPSGQKKEKRQQVPFKSNTTQSSHAAKSSKQRINMEQITDWIEYETGVTLAELKSSTQQRHIVMARSLFVKIAVGEAGIKQSKVAAFLDKNRSLVTRVLEKWSRNDVPPRAQELLHKFPSNLQQIQLATPGIIIGYR